MEKILKNDNIKNSYFAIPSKSFYHRALILSAFKDYPVHIIGKPICDDIYVTIDCLNKLGASIKETNDGVIVSPINSINYSSVLNAKDSGSTYRFLKTILPDIKITGSDRLLNRIESNSKTSQYISGELLRSEIFGNCIDLNYDDIPSKPYIDITKKVINDFKTNPKTYVIEGDYSNASNFLVLGAIKDYVKVYGLNKESIQGDRRILDILKEFGAKVEKTDEYIKVSKGKLKGTNIDGSMNPDLVPVISILASFSKGDTRIYNIGYLRFKESDRINSIKCMLEDLGGSVSVYDDEIIVHSSTLHGGLVKSFNDHRIIMAEAILSKLVDSDIIIDDISAISKSDPSFFDNF